MKNKNQYYPHSDIKEQKAIKLKDCKIEKYRIDNDLKALYK